MEGSLPVVLTEESALFFFYDYYCRIGLHLTALGHHHWSESATATTNRSVVTLIRLLIDRCHTNTGKTGLFETFK